jgi:hypothetical protein
MKRMNDENLFWGQTALPISAAVAAGSIEACLCSNYQLLTSYQNSKGQNHVRH